MKETKTPKPTPKPSNQLRPIVALPLDTAETIVRKLALAGYLPIRVRHPRLVYVVK